MTVLMLENAEACYIYEHCLRPIPNVGWNIAAGGARGNKLGIPRSEETKTKIGNANRGNKRPDLSLLNKKLNKAKFSNLLCPHCDKLGSGPTMYRYHFDNCKQK